MVDYKNILFCTDFSDDANIAFVRATNLAKKYGARLHILHVPHSPFTYERDIVDEHIAPEKSTEGQAFYGEDVIRLAEKELRTAYEPKLREVENHVFVVKGGAPDVEIIRYVRTHAIDLIVMGALGKSRLNRSEPESTVENVSRYAHCHVMAIRNPVRQFTRM
jgi:nucleotide-binding universal stress UspA family protein